MTQEEIYNAWAPASGIWSQWAKPVLFAHAEQINPDIEMIPATSLLTLNWTASADPATVVIVDLPGADSVQAGLLLASVGFRPVPLYNALPGPIASSPYGTQFSGQCKVDVRPIVIAMVQAAGQLSALRMRDDAPPAFLLDANRRISYQLFDDDDDVFDNRSISLPTDFPSGNLLLSHGIRRAVFVQRTNLPPQNDLAHTLRRWQQAGIGISVHAVDQTIGPQPVTVGRPTFYGMFFYSFLALFGYKRNVLGGFGGWLMSGSAG